MAKQDQAANDKTGKAGKWGADYSPPGGALDLNQLDGTLLCDALRHVLEEGDCLQLSLTSDGGACVVTVLSDNGRDKWVVPSTPALESVLRAIRDSH